MKVTDFSKKASLYDHQEVFITWQNNGMASLLAFKHTPFNRLIPVVGTIMPLGFQTPPNC